MRAPTIGRRADVMTYLLGTEPEPVLESVGGQPHAVEQEEAAGGPLGGVPVGSDGQSPAQSVVAHLNPPLRVWGVWVRTGGYAGFIPSLEGGGEACWRRRC